MEERFVAVVAVVDVVALPPMLRLEAVPVSPVPAPIKFNALTVPWTSKACPGLLDPMPTLPEKELIVDPV